MIKDEKIVVENLQLFKRIINKEPSINFKKMDQQFKENVKPFGVNMNTKQPHQYQHQQYQQQQQPKHHRKSLSMVKPPWELQIPKIMKTEGSDDLAEYLSNNSKNSKSGLNTILPNIHLG